MIPYVTPFKELRLWLICSTGPQSTLLASGIASRRSLLNFWPVDSRIMLTPNPKPLNLIMVCRSSFPKGLCVSGDVNLSGFNNTMGDTGSRVKGVFKFEVWF